MISFETSDVKNEPLLHWSGRRSAKPMTFRASGQIEHMAVSGAENTRNWEEIERSESYLVCCMFEEAASLASSVLRRLCENQCNEVIAEDVELYDMRESASMVLVQSFKELGRTAETLKELKLLFGSVNAIPVQVFLTGVCFQMQEGQLGVREFLEEYLCKWRCVDERYYVLASAEADVTYQEECYNQFVIGVEEYLHVVEVYVVTLLSEVLNDMDLAISWVEKAALPEQSRQELLRRVHSMYSSKVISHLQAASTLQTDERGTSSAPLKELKSYEGSVRATDVEKGANEAIMKLPQHKVPCLWWFRTINLKLGNVRLVVSNGNVLLGTLILLMCYFMRTKRANITRILKRQALSMKKAMMELWQLAFSYHVNPLAAVEPLPAAMRASR